MYARIVVRDNYFTSFVRSRPEFDPTIFLFTIAAGETTLSQGSNAIAGRGEFFSWRMKMKTRVTLICLALAGVLCAMMPAAAGQDMAKDAATKEMKWQGHVIRIDKDHSMIDIRGGSAPSNDPRKVAYDSSTEWTKQGKPSTMDEVKEGSFVILLGHVDDKGVFHATRVDLRLPR